MPREDDRNRAAGAAGESNEIGPTYSEAQVAQILRRAAELEQGKAAARPGLSLAEVEKIARESGLDPELVRVAARSISKQREAESLGTRVAGAPTRYTVEREIDGEIGAIHHEALFADLRAAGAASSAMRPPQVSSVGRTLTLSTRTGSGMLEVTLTPRGGKTLLRIDVSTGHLAGALFGGLVGGMGAGPAAWAAAAAAHHAHLPAAAAVAAGVAVLAGVFTLARTIFLLRARGSYRNAEKLADKLEGRVREELKASPQPSSSGP